MIGLVTQYTSHAEIDVDKKNQHNIKFHELIPFTLCIWSNFPMSIRSILVFQATHANLN